MKIALITVTMSKLEGGIFSTDADTRVGLVKDRNPETENRLIKLTLEQAPSEYPNWSNFKAKVSYVPEEILAGWNEH